MNSRELEVASVIEQEYLLHGQLPTYERVDALMNVTRAFYERCITSKEVLDHLDNLGVPARRLLGGGKLGALSIEQLRAVNLLLDFNDNRTDRKKLESLGVTTATYAAWKKDPAFQVYIRDRAENLFGDNLDEVNRSLLDNARSGDISSIKLIYELTGRYNPKTDGQIDPRALVTQILEIIMQEVKDPEIIKNIAAKFQLIAVGNRVAGPKIIDTFAANEVSA